MLTPTIWFFENISRKEAEKLLLAEENARGTFLVRPSEHNPNGYSLSVKDWEEYRGYHVKHYKIKPLDNGGFYISTNKTFDSLAELVNAYTSKYHAKYLRIVQTKTFPTIVSFLCLSTVETIGLDGKLIYAYYQTIIVNLTK
nr:unnamed protein product [Callosobruchus analis]